MATTQEYNQAKKRRYREAHPGRENATPAAYERKRRYRETHREELRQASRAYYVAHREEILAKAPGRRESNPIAYQATKMFSVACACGRLAPNPCEICGAVPTDGHHDDYEKPLQVRWLCRSHHRRLHNERRNHG